MRLNQLLLESQLNESKVILKESCVGLDTHQKKIVEGIVSEFQPLIEASLTADQIQQLFGTVEKASTDAGANRTVLGKGVDVAKKANEVINNVGKWLQDTTPVKAFDQKFEDLKNKINTKFPDSKILDGVSQMGIWAKENPGKTAAIIGVLTALASLAGGPVGGAIAGQVLKGTVELLKGEKLSTAIGKGIKAAAVGWLAGKSMEGIGKMISNVAEYLNPQPIQGFAQFYQENIGNGLPNIFRDAHVVGTKVQLSQFNKMWSAAARQWQSGDFEGARGSFAAAQDFASKVTAETYNAMGTEDPTEKIRQLNDMFTGLAAAAQGAATGATGMDKKGQPVKQESVYKQARPLSEGQVYMVFSRVARLNEGPIWDKVKGAAGKAAGAVVQKAGQIGTNLTTKVTADKLNSAWKAAGSPMDSAEVEKILAAAGVSPEITTKVFTDLKIPVGGAEPAAGSVDFEQVKKMIAALPADRKARLLKFLQKNTTATPA